MSSMTVSLLLELKINKGGDCLDMCDRGREDTDKKDLCHGVTHDSNLLAVR